MGKQRERIEPEYYQEHSIARAELHILLSGFVGKHCCLHCHPSQFPHSQFLYPADDKSRPLICMQHTVRNVFFQDLFPGLRIMEVCFELRWGCVHSTTICGYYNALQTPGYYFSISSLIRLKVPINPVGGGIWMTKTCDEITSLEAWARVGAFAVWLPLLKLTFFKRSLSMRAFPIKVKLTLRNNPVVVGEIFAPEPVDHVYNVAIWIIPGTNPRWMNWTEFQVVVGLNSSIQEM